MGAECFTGVTSPPGPIGGTYVEFASNRHRCRLGFVVGSAVNMALIALRGKMIAPPAGADVSTMEGLKASMHPFEPRHFPVPVSCARHGTFAGAWSPRWWRPASR